MFVYADNAATTKPCKAATEVVNEFNEKYYGNPSSLHTVGQIAKEKLEEARAVMAKYLNAEPGEIYFTSGGSLNITRFFIRSKNLKSRVLK